MNAVSRLVIAIIVVIIIIAATIAVYVTFYLYKPAPATVSVNWIQVQNIMLHSF